ncbi:lectin-like [Lissotriton helveticus]
MEESRMRGGARSRVLLLSITLFFTVGWVDSGVTPGPLRNTANNKNPPDGVQRVRKKNDWQLRKDYCYRYFSVQMTWGEAEVFCQLLALGSHLASAHSKEAMEFLKTFAFSLSGVHSAYWMGASDLYKKKRFVWTDGTLMDYKSWHPEEPNNAGDREHCVCSNYKSPGLWGDVRCDSNLAFICKAPNPSGDKPLCVK